MVAGAFPPQSLKSRTGELDLGARELGFFEGAGAIFSDVSGAGAIKIFEAPAPIQL